MQNLKLPSKNCKKNPRTFWIILNKLRREHHNCNLFFTRRQGFTDELEIGNPRIVSPGDNTAVLPENPQKVLWEL